MVNLDPPKVQCIHKRDRVSGGNIGRAKSASGQQRIGYFIPGKGATTCVLLCDPLLFRHHFRCDIEISACYFSHFASDYYHQLVTAHSNQYNTTKQIIRPKTRSRHIDSRRLCSLHLMSFILNKEGKQERRTSASFILDREDPQQNSRSQVVVRFEFIFLTTPSRLISMATVNRSPDCIHQEIQRPVQIGLMGASTVHRGWTLSSSRGNFPYLSISPVGFLKNSLDRKRTAGGSTL